MSDPRPSGTPKAGAPNPGTLKPGAEKPGAVKAGAPKAGAAGPAGTAQAAPRQAAGRRGAAGQGASAIRHVDPAQPPIEPTSLTPLVLQRSIIICCGSGGVGKTTTSAAFALRAAAAGRRACVVTIDPARRLANALGLDTLTNKPTRVKGDWAGTLDALMLDPKSTFDDLVHRYAPTEEQAQIILGNRIYRSLTSALSGTQEYMAMEKLYELVEEGGFDVVVVDTPPTRNALDFLEAPGRLTRFLENRLFQMLLMPGRTYLRAVGMATQALLRTLSKVAGTDIVYDAVAFFQAFEGMEEGFRRRAGRVRQLLADPATAFVLVASPRRDSIDEAVIFSRKLEESSLHADALVVNRVHPRFDAGTPLPDVPDGSALAALVENYRGLHAIAEREEQVSADLVQRVAPAPVLRVPLLGSDVHDLDGLTLVARHLFGPLPTPAHQR